MGLRIEVYRNADRGDCTNGGISSKHDTLTVTNIDGPFEPTKEAPAVLIEMHTRGCLRLYVAGDRERGVVMFGGNYGAASDSRFARKCEQLLGHYFYGAVPIHDRKE